MKLLMLVLVFLASGYSITGRSIHPKIPTEAIEVIEPNPGLPLVPRASRQVEASLPVTIAKVEVVPSNEQSAATYVLNYVDFGGHTGENGAFGWYADFPV